MNSDESFITQRKRWVKEKRTPIKTKEKKALYIIVLDNHVSSISKRETQVGKKQCFKQQGQHGRNNRKILSDSYRKKGSGLITSKSKKRGKLLGVGKGYRSV